jgi:glycosyltransferase involved in cell wall biosynthesis
MIGVDERYFSPPDPKSSTVDGNTPAQPVQAENVCRVLYYGAYLPNHGIRTLLEAIRLLADQPQIQFEMVGKGIEQDLARQLAKQWGLNNVTFVDWLEKKELAQHILQADIILGAFGNTLHSRATIHNKTYEGLAMGKVVLTGDSPAMRQFFHHGEDVYLCPQADAQGLAHAIRTLFVDPALRQRIGENGQRHVRQHFTLHQIGESFQQILIRLINTYDR